MVLETALCGWKTIGLARRGYPGSDGVTLNRLCPIGLVRAASAVGSVYPGSVQVIMIVFLQSRDSYSELTVLLSASARSYPDSPFSA